MRPLGRELGIEKWETAWRDVVESWYSDLSFCYVSFCPSCPSLLLVPVIPHSPSPDQKLAMILVEPLVLCFSSILPSSYLYLPTYRFVCLSVCLLCTHMHARTGMWKSEDNSRICSHCQSSGSWGSNADWQTYWQLALPSGPTRILRF